MTTTGALEQAALFVADGDTTDTAAREKAKILLADAMVLALASNTVPGAQRLFELGAGLGQHVSWASGRALGPADAVQANAAAICARFQDDTDMSSWSHPGSFVVPAAVAAAIEADATYGSLIDGLIAGYAFTVWLGGHGRVALRMMETGRRPSPNFGTAGACAGASRAMSLSPEQTTHALSGALLVGRGSLHSVGSGGEDWRLHNPGAARDGFLYCLAAANGMTAGPGALEAKNGFLAMFAGIQSIPEELMASPRADMINEVWHKAMPTLGDNMAVAVAAREMHRRVAGRAIDRVVIHMNEHFANFPGTQARPPYPSLTSALSSVRFVTAQLLTTGELDFAAYQNRDDQALVELASRIEVFADSDLDYTDAVVSVTTADGEASCRAMDLPRTLFFRDTAEQRRAAQEILGDRGAMVVDTLLSADDGSPCQDVINEVLRTYHSANPYSTMENSH